MASEGPNPGLIRAFQDHQQSIENLEGRLAGLKDQLFRSTSDGGDNTDREGLLLELLEVKEKLKTEVDANLTQCLPGFQGWNDDPVVGGSVSDLEEDLKMLGNKLSAIDEDDTVAMMAVIDRIAKTVERRDCLKKNKAFEQMKLDIWSAFNEAMAITGERVYCHCSEGTLEAVETMDETLDNFGRKYWGCPLYVSEEEPGCGFVQWK